MRSAHCDFFVCFLLLFFFVVFMSTCRAPHLEMSPKSFTMATVALFSASEQTHCALVVCDPK